MRNFLFIIMAKLGTIYAGGPHLASSSKIGKAFKLTKVSGAYWRGDSNNEMFKEFMEHVGVQKRFR